MSGDRVLLADIKILTFTRGKSTTHRRVNAVKQLICQDNGSIGYPKKKEYLFESATCINEGIGENMMLSWSCTASSLPKDTELGSVNVSCEGYTYPDDPYVLAGSCAMEYTLTAPTPKGPFAALVVAFMGLFACSKKFKKKPRGGAPPAYHEVSTLDTLGALPTAHTVHLDDMEKSTTCLGKTGAVATAHPAGTTASAAKTGGAKPSGKASTSLETGPAAGAAMTAAAAAAAAVAELASHGKKIKREDHAMPKGWESKVDPLTGKTFFYVNHDTRETSWVDPRKPIEKQPLLGGNNAHSSTYQGATTSGREGGRPSTNTQGGTSGRGNDHTSTARSGSSGREGGGVTWSFLFGRGGRSSTARSRTRDRGGSGSSGGGGIHSSSASGGTSGK